MKCLVLGYGSIGKRHKRILDSMGHDVSVVSKHSEGDFFYKSLDSYYEVHKSDYVVISSETRFHAQDLSNILGFHSGPILVEKPLFNFLKDGESLEISDEQRHRIFVGYNLRYLPLIQKLKLELKDNNVFSASFFCGSYLPNWREGDYSLSYSASKERGGGVLRDVSHELDLAQYLLGEVVKTSAQGGQLSDLNITSEDTIQFIGQSNQGALFTVFLNYYDRIGERRIKIFTNEKTIEADLIKNELNINGKVETFDGQRDTSYQLMHKCILEGDLSDCCLFEEGVKTLQLIEKVDKQIATE